MEKSKTKLREHHDGCLFRRSMRICFILFSAGFWTMLSAAPVDTDIPKSVPGTEEIKQNPVLTATGTVTDPNGEPLPGVAVMEKGNATNGTMTDVDGKFTLKISAGATLVVSYMGFEKQELKAGINMAIVLKEQASSLDEVVVVGYGTQKKVNLSGAVSAVGGEVLEDRPIANIGQGLQGVIPNLQINPSNNAPGSGSSFNIRGYTSINGGSPLVLIDGVDGDYNSLNPSDVASVSVLKDASSAAIYGARAAYGVILITTKSGKNNMKPTINVTGSWATSAPTYIPKYMNSMDYMAYIDNANHNSGSGDYFDSRLKEYAKKYFDDPSHNLPVYYDPAIDTNGKYNYCGNTDWADELYKNGSLQQYGISLRGGSANTRYYLSYGYLDLKGILAAYDDKYQRHSINIDVSSDIYKWLTIGAKIKYSYAFEDHPTNGAGNSGLTYDSGLAKNDLSPLMPVRHPDGNFAGQGNYTNPFAVAAQAGYYQRKMNNLHITGSVALHPLEGWNINADFTFNPYSRNIENVTQQFKEYHADGTSNIYPWSNPNGVSLENNNDYYTALNVYTDYTKSFDKHNFKVMAGYNQEIKRTKYFWAQRKNLIDNDLPVINRATGEQTVGGSTSNYGIQGLFGRLSYDYDGKYIFEMNGRYDGTSRFPKGKRFGMFPSVSAAWRISSESFMESLQPVLNNLKVRGSFGSLGNQEIAGSLGNFAYIPGYEIQTNQSYIIGNSLGVAVTAPPLVSPNFTWEKVNQWNVGLDFAFLNERLNGSFDYFNRYTKRMLTSPQPLPGVLGTNVPNENAADLKTAGWELSLTWRDKIGQDFRYHATFVLSDAQAEITKFTNTTGTLNSRYVGQKVGEIWGFKTEGLFQSQAEIDAHASQKDLYGTWEIGDVKYKDLNNDDKISRGNSTLEDHGDLTIIGNTTPRYQYGITLGGEYKGIDFEIFLQGVGKRAWWIDDRFWGINNEWQVPYRDAADFWTPENTGAHLPKPYIDGGHGNRQVSDRYLQDASYLRFKQLSVGYTLPVQWTQKASISKARIYVTGQNIFTWTNLSKIYDPELIGNAGSSSDPVKYMSYPVAKTWSVGVNITF